MTEDRAVVDRSRSEDLTDISFKGLLPQLIDVLTALAEGQELLSRKIRDAKLAYSGDSNPVVNSMHAATSDIAIPDPLTGGTSFSSSLPIRAQSPTDQGDLGAGRPSGNGDGNGSSPRPSSGTDLSSAATARTDWLNSSDDTGTDALNYNYNFFDELDARLADLHDPGDPCNS
jgi:hypothetical protein